MNALAKSTNPVVRYKGFQVSVRRQSRRQLCACAELSATSSPLQQLLVDVFVKNAKQNVKALVKYVQDRNNLRMLMVCGMDAANFDNTKAEVFQLLKVRCCSRPSHITVCPMAHMATPMMQYFLGQKPGMPAKVKKDVAHNVPFLRNFVTSCPTGDRQRTMGRQCFASVPC